MKIKQKISYSFLFAVALLTGVVIIVFYYSTRSSLEKAIFERLAVTTTSRSYNAEMFLKEHKTVAEVMANTSAIKEVFQIIDFDSGFSDYIKKINLELKRFVETEDDVFQAFIIDSDGLIIASSDVEAQRLAFADLTDGVYSTVKMFNVTGLNVYYQFCPMARDGKGANWLSLTSEIENPYYGEAMLTCGETKETLK